MGPTEIAEDRDVSLRELVGGLALAVLEPVDPPAAARALAWAGALARMGLEAPLHLVHDLGAVLAEGAPWVGDGEADLGLSPEGREAHRAYRRLMAEALETESARRARRSGLSDDLVVASLARILSLLPEVTRRSGPMRALDAPLSLNALPSALRGRFRRDRGRDRSRDEHVLQSIVAARLQLLTTLDALDPGGLAVLLSLGGSPSNGAIAQADLLNALAQPESEDVVDFALEVLPSVLETKAPRSSTEFSAAGYAGLSRRGEIDGLLPSELAWEDDELLRRWADDELLYLARETSQDEQRGVHHVLVDASASMRGERATFARATAMTAAKKLLMSGDDVLVYFFDGRLHGPWPCRSGAVPIPQLLSFRGERGRNPGRVLETLSRRLEAAARRDPRSPVVHLFTHAALYLPRERLAALRRLTPVSAVFLLPSEGELHVDYLDLLTRYWVVNQSTLEDRPERARRAREILESVEPTPRTP